MNRKDFFKVLLAIPILAVAKKYLPDDTGEVQRFEEYHKRCVDMAGYNPQPYEIPYNYTPPEHGDMWVSSDGKWYWNEYLKCWTEESGVAVKVKG